jgi:hypothetical protein
MTTTYDEPLTLGDLTEWAALIIALITAFIKAKPPED